MAEANNTEERPNEMILGQLERKRAMGSFTRKMKARLITHTHSYLIFKTCRSYVRQPKDIHCHLPELVQPPCGNHSGMKFLFGRLFCNWVLGEVGHCQEVSLI